MRTRPSRRARRSHPGRPVVVALAVLTALAFVAGCSSDDDASTTTTTATSPTAAAKVTGKITVSAAASLTEAFGTMKADFEQANPGSEVTFNFGSSGQLATQIQQGAPADAAAFADQASMTTLSGAGLLASPAQVFARNQLVIVTKPGNPKGVKDLADLATVGTVSLCDVKAPCGKYADQILQQAKVTIPTGSVTRGVDVKSTLRAVTDGDAEAAIVYVTDAKAAGSKVATVEIATAQNVVAEYPIAVVKASTEQPTATAFQDWVLGPKGQQVLQDAGFLAP